MNKAVIFLTVLFLLQVSAAPGFSQDAACSAPFLEPVTDFKLDSRPRFAISTRDNCWIFVAGQDPQRTSPSFPLGQPGLAVVRREAGNLKQVRFVHTPERSWGMNLTPDGKVLIVGGNRRVSFFDVEQLTVTQGNPLLGFITDHRFGEVGVGMALTNDGRYLFVPQNVSHWLTIIDVEQARSKGYNAGAIVGGLPIGAGGVVMLSHDEKWLYVMNTHAPVAYSWPAICQAAAQPDAFVSEAVLFVVDVERAKASSRSAVLASTSLGCYTSRIALSPDGHTLYMAGGPVKEGTGMRETGLTAFDTREAAAGKITRIGSASFGEHDIGAGIGLAILGGGRIAAVSSIIDVPLNNVWEWIGEPKPGAVIPGERPGKAAAMMLIDTAKLASGGEAVVRAIPAAGDPRNLQLSADGSTLLLTNYNTQTLQLIDVSRLPLEPAVPDGR